MPHFRISGNSFGMAMNLYNMIDKLLGQFTRNVFFENTVNVWLRFVFSRDWMRKDRSCHQLLQANMYHLPIHVRNFVSYVGTTSYLRQVDFFNQHSGQKLIKLETLNVNFDPEVRKSIPLPEEYKAMMLQSIVEDRQGFNTKPTVPAYPMHVPMSCQFEREIDVDTTQTDSNKHANNKMFVFFAFETLNGAIANKTRHHDIEVEQFDIIHEREAVEGDRLLCQILTTDDKTDDDQMTYYAVIWNKRQATRLCYCIFRLTHFNDSKL